PSDVRLPRERAAARGLEQDRERVLAAPIWAALLRLQLPVMVVVAELDAVAREALGHAAELAAERAPERGVGVAQLGRHRGHEQQGETDGLARLGDRVGPLAQRREADMAGRGLEAARIEPGARSFGIVEVRAQGLDMA